MMKKFLKSILTRKPQEEVKELDTRYGSRDLMQNWYDVDRYFKEESFKENKELNILRPFFNNLQNKKDLVGVEVGMGNGLNSLNILNNLDIKKLYIIDRNLPPLPPGDKVLNDERVYFLQGDSLDCLSKINEDLDFVYLDASHEYEYVVKEIEISYDKIVIGGILGGHDYDQLGVCSAVQTFMINLWKHNKEQPSNFFTESCRDGHPGYPKEYLEYGFPIDWWAIKEIEPGKDFKVNHLRNG